jgi:hypothetical protein
MTPIAARVQKKMKHFKIKKLKAKWQRFSIQLAVVFTGMK